MQVQGSGKIRLREGGLVRLAYAQQNGHPFRPRVTRGDTDFAITAIKARGLIAGSSAGAASARPDAAATKVSAPVNAARSEERRVGKEWVSTGRSRWGRYH